MSKAALDSISVVVTDIEGTTTAIDFVHRVLFPYSKAALPAFLRQRASEARFAKLVNEILCEEKVETVSSNDAVENAITILLKWIDEDRKHGILKELQGMIWHEGYESGAFVSHLYPDVPVKLREWHQQGIGLAIYSSGSVEAQKLLFSHTEYGDLTSLFLSYFDTAVGAKRESKSYARIAEALKVVPSRILFLSDIEAELDAAKAIGFATIQLCREDTTRSLRHETTASFSDIKL